MNTSRASSPPRSTCDWPCKDRPRDAVLEELRQKVSLLPGTNVTIGQPISHRIDHMLSGTRANIAVKIFGDDLAGRFGKWPVRSRPRWPKCRGVVDLSTEAQTDIPTLSVRVDSAAAARQGLADRRCRRGAADRSRRPYRRPGARRADRLSAGRSIRARRFDRSGIRRRDADSDAGSPTDPRCRPSPRSSAIVVRTSSCARTSQRRIVVQSNVSGRDLRSVVNDIQARVSRNVTLPRGYHVEYGGQFESEAQASRQLLWLSVGVIVAIFFILSSAFGSSRDGAADHAEPAARADRRRARRLSRRRRAVRRIDRRIHHAVRR